CATALHRVRLSLFASPRSSRPATRALWLRTSASPSDPDRGASVQQGACWRRSPPEREHGARGGTAGWTVRRNATVLPCREVPSPRSMWSSMRCGAVDHARLVAVKAITSSALPLRGALVWSLFGLIGWSAIAGVLLAVCR